MFNNKESDLLELKPIAEPVPTPEEIEEMEEEVVTIPQEDIFKQPEKKEKNVKLEVEEGVMTKAEVNAWGKPKLRGVGKRGKDKQKRKKKPPTEKQLAHLARMRKLAAQKRAAVALEKKRKKEEAEKILKEKESIKPTRMENAKRLERAILQPPKPAPTPAVNKKVHYSTNTPRQPRKPSDMEFFELMERYEKYKEMKNIKIKKEKSLQERLNEKRRNNPHPNRRIPPLQRPSPPRGKYHDIFNYKGRL